MDTPLLNDMPQRFPLRRDQFGCLIMKDGDPGDAPQQDGMIAVASRIIGIPCDEFDHALKAYEINESGIFRRHPLKWNDPSDFSRDQQRGLFWGMAFQNKVEPMKRMVWAHIKRFGKYQNHDIASPQNWGEYIRGFALQEKYKLLRHLWPFMDMVGPSILLVLLTQQFRWLFLILISPDMFLLVDTFILLIKGRDPDNVGDDKNHILSLFGARFTMKTFLSVIADVIYFDWRPRSYGSYYHPKYGEDLAITWYNERPLFNIVEPDPVQAALNWYFRKETGNNPVNEYWRFPLFMFNKKNR